MEPTRSAFATARSGSSHDRRSCDTGLPLDPLDDANLLLHSSHTLRGIGRARRGAGQLHVGTVELRIVGVQENQGGFIGDVIQNVGIFKHVVVELVRSVQKPYRLPVAASTCPSQIPFDVPLTIQTQVADGVIECIIVIRKCHGGDLI